MDRWIERMEKRAEWVGKTWKALKTSEKVVVVGLIVVGILQFIAGTMMAC